ncbi:DNA-binding protein, partial [Salmonella enterica subsp. enterica serovar Hartford]|nr:DNA-binding protein [Salmonella enterica subsp. enterica serovar Hartford]
SQVMQVYGASKMSINKGVAQ